MKISELRNPPQWLLEAKTKNAEVQVWPSGWVTWNSGDFLGGDFLGGNFLGGNFLGGKVKGLAAQKLRAYSNLYPYQVSAFVTKDGKRYVQMGCLLHTLDKWEEIGIRNSNPSEFPNDGSERCEERVVAFEFAKAAVLRMKIEEKVSE